MAAFPYPVKEAVFIARQPTTASGERQPCLALVRHKQPSRAGTTGDRFALADDIAGRVAGFKTGDCRLCRYSFPRNVG